MQNKLVELKDLFISNLKLVKNNEELEKLDKDFLWKKWKLNEILKWIKDLSVEDKKIIWPEANKLKIFIQWELEKNLKN